MYFCSSCVTITTFMFSIQYKSLFLSTCCIVNLMSSLNIQSMSSYSGYFVHKSNCALSLTSFLISEFLFPLNCYIHPTHSFSNLAVFLYFFYFHILNHYFALQFCKILLFLKSKRYSYSKAQTHQPMPTAHLSV